MKGEVMVPVLSLHPSPFTFFAQNHVFVQSNARFCTTCAFFCIYICTLKPTMGILCPYVTDCTAYRFLYLSHRICHINFVERQNQIFFYYKVFMSLKIIVLAKQVPDTRNVGKDAMTAEGTVNRAALPAIFNPEDLNALEQALRLKEQNPGSSVGILTMGPPRAGEIIRQGLYRGADTGWLLTDRLFAGADTLATSYALATAIKKIGDVDIVIGGRQAIDGDTAQVGPQVAQKLGLNQVTYAEEILKIENGKATIRRHIDGGVETVEAPLPVVITVNGSAAPCRPCNAKLVMKYKYATCPMERPAEKDERMEALYAQRDYLTLNQWSVADVDGDVNQCGLAGSPTKVKAVKNIVFQAKESKTLTASDADVEGMIKELLEEKIIG